MQPALLSGIGSAFAYTLMQILFKRGSPRASPLALTAWLGLLLPVWAAILWFGTATHLLVLTLTPAYLSATVLWALLSTATLALLIALIQRLSLTGLTAYRKAFITLIALTVDTFYLGQAPTLPKLAAIALILACSINLGRPSAKATRFIKPRTPPLTQLLWVFGFSVLFTAQTYAYRYALALQPDLVSHVVFAKTLMAAFSLALWALPQTREHKLPVGNRRMLAIVACFFMGSLLEGVALRTLSVSVIAATTLVSAAIFTAHDLWHRDLPRTRATWLALVGIFAGFALLAYPF
jgi:drug/metabolite transporter (DMT)-like permease